MRLFATTKPPIADIRCATRERFADGTWELTGYSNARAAFARDHQSFHTPVDDSFARAQRRAYFAATSFTDANFGVVVEALEREGFYDNTIVVLWGDHGWHLGDADTWAKMTNFESAVRIPLIIKCPWKTAAVGRITSVLAEAVDLCAPLCAMMPSRASLDRAMLIAAVSVCSSVVIHYFAYVG